MRALVVSIWVFINLVFFGMCGYMYVLWSQYWMYLEKQPESSPSTYDQQIYYYNRGYIFNDTSKSRNNNHTEPKRIKHSVKQYNNTIIVKNSRPRFPNLQDKDFEADTRKYTCFPEDTSTDCDEKILKYKDNILKEFRKVFTEESNIFKSGIESRYDVQYKGPRGNYMSKSSIQLGCELKKVRLKTLKKQDLQHILDPLREYLPKSSIFQGNSYNSCAVVASSGALKNSGLGEAIDSHDVVLRFNHAPTMGFEEDVGSKTTMRVLNSQVVSKPQFQFLDSNLYKNVTLLVWDPSNYTATLSEWLKRPEHDLFSTYIDYKRLFPKSKFFILNPQSLWRLWDFLQSNSPGRLRRNPPSSGFLGLAVLLPLCNYVDMFEYIPSTRVTKKCHYYDAGDNLACTFGVWHPLSAEKLIAYQMNVLDDRTVFEKGFIRILGFRKIHC